MGARRARKTESVVALVSGIGHDHGEERQEHRAGHQHPPQHDQAVRNGIERAGQTLRHIDWFEVTQIRGHAKDGQVEHFQVGMKVGFRLEDE